MSISVFLPCRAGSQRVPKKNIKPFYVFQNGLIELKLKQLLSCELIDEVILSTNDEDILNFSQSITNKKLRTHKRAEHLCTSETSTDELVSHALELIPEGHILWTHVTSPFINSDKYKDIIEAYLKCIDNGFDSLMTTTPIHGFLWNESSPLNYDREIEKWPRTQTIPPIHEVNSGAFINSADNYRKLNDRIGKKPYLMKLDKITAHDIDWHEDFVIAESIAKNSLINL